MKPFLLAIPCVFTRCLMSLGRSRHNRTALNNRSRGRNLLLRICEQRLIFRKILGHRRNPCGLRSGCLSLRTVRRGRGCLLRHARVFRNRLSRQQHRLISRRRTVIPTISAIAALPVVRSVLAARYARGARGAQPRAAVRGTRKLRLRHTLAAASATAPAIAPVSSSPFLLISAVLRIALGGLGLLFYLSFAFLGKVRSLNYQRLRCRCHGLSRRLLTLFRSLFGPLFRSLL